MNRLLVIILFLNYGYMAHAQFNTITPRPKRYQVERIGQGSNVEVKEKTEPKTNVTDTVNQKIKRTDRYLGVAYPLKEIHVTSPFGLRTDPFTGKKASHNGIDLRANHEPVYAMLAGEVVKVGKDRRSGIYVTLKHGSFTVSYCHLSKVLVGQKQVVRPGEPIGISGSTGRSTGPHLHLTLKMGSKVCNPQILFDYIATVRKKELGN